MSIIQTLIDSGELVLYHDYRGNSMRDLSGNGNDGVGTDLQWCNRGVGFPLDTSMITVADAPELQLTEGTLIMYSASGFMSQATYERFISKRDVGGTCYDLYADANRLLLYDGTNARVRAAVLIGAKCIAINMSNGATGEVFLNGLSAGNLDAASAISVDDAPLIIGNIYTGTVPLRSTLSAALIVNRKLTPAEHAAVYAELDATTWPTKAWGRALGVYGPELVTNGNFETGDPPTTWSNWMGTFSAQPGNVFTGSQVGRLAYLATSSPYIGQTILTAGKTYRLDLWARGDGTMYPRANNSDTILWTGTHFENVNTTWVDITTSGAYTGTLKYLALYPFTLTALQEHDATARLRIALQEI